MLILDVVSLANERDVRRNIRAYMSITSVRQILLLASTAVKGEMPARKPDGTWPEEAARLAARDTVRFGVISFACTLDEFYAQTALAIG